MKFSYSLPAPNLFIKNLLITGLILVLLSILAWLSTHYFIQTDVTVNTRNSLSETSQKLLDTLSDPIKITAYINNHKPLREKIKKILKRYSDYKTDITIQFINPESVPEKLRTLGIDDSGVIILDYQGRSKNLKVINESSLSNALYHLASASDRWVTFLSGHGERSPNGKANHDLGLFGKQLEQQQIKIVALNLGKISAIPDNSSFLVIASPSLAFLEAEMGIIQDYIIKGGNLLWLTDPQQQQLPALATYLGITILPGTIIDSNSQLYGVDNPSFIIVNDYSSHAITKNLQTMTVFPVAAALEMQKNSLFKAIPILTSTVSSWTETGTIAAQAHYDKNSDERKGPLNFGYALSRKHTNGQQQRIIVLGDSDFLSNTYLGNVSNQDFGLRLFNWLSYHDQFIEIPAKITNDRQLQLSRMQIAVMGFGFLIILPLLLILSGIFIWRKRKRY